MPVDEYFLDKMKPVNPNSDITDKNLIVCYQKQDFKFFFTRVIKTLAKNSTYDLSGDFF